MNNRAVKEAFEEGTRIDRAMNRAFFAAIRLHRMHGVPMAMWRDGQVCYVDPREIPLPEEAETEGDSLEHRSARDRRGNQNGSGRRQEM